MFSPFTVLAVDLLYITGLFLVALWVEKRTRVSRKIADSRWGYSLSLAVYCTSWTYYGSVGKAVTSGPLFLTIYLGPTLAIILWWHILRKMARIKNQHRITSIADFVAARYNKSQVVAALATATALVGTMPYIALQIKAMITTFHIISMPQGAGGRFISENMGLIIITLMTVFTIVFGVRRLDPTERHQGMIAAVAVESIVKLAAFMACGLFVTYILNNGFADVLTLPENPPTGTVADTGLFNWGEQSYTTWATYLVLAMSAIMFLPRQFHVAVVENSSEKQILHAIWVFPLYMLLINVFVLPIAMEGLSQGLSPQQADTYVLRIPLLHNRPFLALFVFLGGFSAAMSMVMISSMTMSTMITNHLLLPLLNNIKPLSFLRRHLLRCRWAAVALVIFIGYWFESRVGDSYMLVNMGMISFAAVLQFAPPLLIGLYWSKANKAGALMGLGAGTLIWAYTLLLPAFVRSGWLPISILDGLFGLEALQPEALLFLKGLDPLTHTLFWSMFFNIGFLVLGSLLFEQSGPEQSLAREFTLAMRPKHGASVSLQGVKSILLEEKTALILEGFLNYFDPHTAQNMVKSCIQRAGLSGRKRIRLIELADLQAEVEKALAGAIGSATAHKIIRKSDIFTDKERDWLSNMYAGILAGLQLTPEEMTRKVDYYREREELITRHAEELEGIVTARTEDLARKAQELEEANIRLKEMDQLKTQFLSSVSHELRTPLTSVLGFAKLIAKTFERSFMPLAKNNRNLERSGKRISVNLGIISKEGKRLTRLINDVLDLNKIEDGRMEWYDMEMPLGALVTTSVNAVSGMFATKLEVRLVLNLASNLPVVRMDPDKFVQVLVNLMNNACKFTDKGEVTVSVEYEPGGQVRIRVSDTGKGMAPEELSKIFDKFYQVSQGDTLMNKPRGSGLGLVICKGIVEHYNGSIEVQSTPGKGSVFDVVLPPEIVVAESAANLEKTAPDARNDQGVILVVEDDPAVNSLISQLLSEHGYRVHTALNGMEALEKARDLKPDLITMDIMMPVMDGRTTISLLREDPELSRIPVMIISAVADRTDAEAAVALDKPLDETGLLQAVSMLLRKNYPTKGTSLLVSKRAHVVDDKHLFLCPGELQPVTPAMVMDRLSQGFEGNILIPHELQMDLDLEYLVAQKGVQVVIMAPEADAD